MSVFLDHPYTWFFVVGAATLGVIYFLPKVLAHPVAEKKTLPLRSPFRRAPVGILSTEELAAYNGEGGGRILVSISGRIFDMTRGRDFYGPEGPYHAFAGSDATYMLGAMSTDSPNRNKRNFGQWDPSWVSEYSSLHPTEKVPYCENGEFSRETLEGWLNSFVVKYPVVGKLRGFMDVCEESWNSLSTEADLAPGNATNGNEPLDVPIQSQGLATMSLNELDQSKHVSIAGYVFDVSICSFVYSRISGDFPGALGHDISVAIIKDDFSEEWLDQHITSNLNSNQQDQLELLVRKFRETYPTVGVLSDASKYRPVRQQVSSITNESNNIPPSSSTNEAEQREPMPNVENENNSRNETPKEKDTDEWDLVQDNDIPSPAEKRTDGKSDKNKMNKDAVSK